MYGRSTCHLHTDQLEKRRISGGGGALFQNCYHSEHLYKSDPTDWDVVARPDNSQLIRGAKCLCVVFMWKKDIFSFKLTPYEYDAYVVLYIMLFILWTLEQVLLC